jgi:hypothetical protein
MRAGKTAITMLVIGLVAALASGCASTERSVLYDRDEPAQRLASMVDGIVARVDQPAQVVVLDTGQMYRVSSDQAIVVRGQPVRLANVQPGTRVSIVSGTPVVYQNGQYVSAPPATATVSTPGTAVTTTPSGTIVTPAPGPVVAAPPAGTVVAPPPGAIVTSPPGTVVASPPAVVTGPAATSSVVRMYGQVVDVERNGNVKIRLPDGNAFELRPPAGAVYRKGDPVTIDMTFGAPAPSALPR